jgi:hypothetical protein
MRYLIQPKEGTEMARSSTLKFTFSVESKTSKGVFETVYEGPDEDEALQFFIDYDEDPVGDPDEPFEVRFVIKGEKDDGQGN